MSKTTKSWYNVGHLVDVRYLGDHMPSRRELANAIRALSMDAVQKANSGHPGAPMGMADIAEVLWNDFLRHNPNDPHWLNRDRFVLSNGHGSMLIYSLLHLTGYDLSIEDIKQFRQLHSRTPGHPEFGITPGIETTTGPLGQGISNAVGMALAERLLAAHFNRPGFNIVDHYTYTFLGDGCLMEGISHEACSLAGHWQLGKLIAFWDDNGISIDGKVADWFTDDTPKRFEAYGWHVVRDVDGHDSESIKQAILLAREVTDKPSLICCKTQIAYGSPNLAGTADAHGAPLGEKEIAAAREFLNWPYPPFEIPDKIYKQWNAKTKGALFEEEWKTTFNAYQATHPELATEFIRRMNGELPPEWLERSEEVVVFCHSKAESIATRKASQNALQAFGPLLPELLGGSADLTGSNLTMWRDSKPITNQDFSGNYVYYGVREFGMSAIMNGVILHGGFIPYGGTFLTFSDYARNAVRMAALMKLGVIFVYTHDSIGLGEDGPTHQPIEHISSLRLIPGLSVWRPCDAVESVVAWQYAIEHRHQPSCLLFSRQNLAHQHRDSDALSYIKRGGYILWETNENPTLAIIATGSEVDLAMQAAQILSDKNISVRVISMPSTDAFSKQEASYQKLVLPDSIKKRVAIEAGASDFWYKYVGLQGKIIGIDRFGDSAPAKEIFKELGFTVENVVQVVQAYLTS